ncbi:sulfatase-like hydrolase/transferase [bacterium]|nr:sulfatase-like hydrolase/transferase [bacterium]
MSNKKRFIYLILFGTFIGFILGITFTIAEITAHNYFFYKLHYLLVLSAQTNLNTWILTINAVFLFAGFVYIFSKWFLSFWIKNNQHLTFLAAFIVCLSLLLIGKWIIPVYLTGELRQHILLVDIAWIASLIVLGLIIIKGLFSKLMKLKPIHCLRWLSPIILGALLIFNVGISLYKYLNPPTGPNVIFLISDALRRDHLSAYGYERQTSPTIDKLAKEGIIFRNIHSDFVWTKPSIASIFTSLYGDPYAIMTSFAIMPNTMMTMAEIFKDNGYRTYFFNAGNYFIDDDFNYDQGFDEYTYFDPPSKEVFARADVVVEKLLKDIAQHKNAKFFAYAHLMDTHLPYHKNQFNNLYSDNIPKILEPGKINLYTLQDMTLKKVAETNIKEQLIALYDGQIRYVDESIKQLLAGLKELNILNNTIIIISADHGEAFWEHGHVGHGHIITKETTSVPFIMWGADIEPSQNTSAGWLSDSLPTILHVAQIKMPFNNFQGKDILKSTTSINEREKRQEQPKDKSKPDTHKELKSIDKEQIEKLKALGYM